ncbi:MAG: hypothetical protein FWE72_09735 [Spirochaetaceae bacterium]|nr:hypothetical protein [Spirochaetaceae bacterium]
MTKKIIIILIVLSVISGNAFAQYEDEIRAKNNLTVSLGFVGAALSYERIFNSHFSVLADISYTTLALIDEFTVSGKGRVYPFGGSYYLEMGLGYSYGRGAVDMMRHMVLGLLTLGWYFTILEEEDLLARRGGFLIQPGMGWKIDIGKPDGFVLPISMGLDFKSGKILDVMPYVRIGLGYSF